tara:strand:- start:2508 stop:3641 length:1134 start_codon:yes stop_codon:yes gene_type:complete
MNLSFGKEWRELRKFEKLKEKERSIVFYAENKASMNHYKLLIDELTNKENFQICYVTSVKDDPMLTKENKKILTFYIGNGAARIKFFIYLKSKILIMDMPDLGLFHILKSKVYPVHYIYIFHSMFSIHSYLRKSALDNYDTIFCVGEHHKKEILETERVYGLKPKKLIDYGFGRLDRLLEEKNDFKQELTKENLIIIAPSYGNDNLLNICGLELIEILLNADFKVILRPHFRIFKESKELIEKIRNKFQNDKNFLLEEGVIKPEIFHSSKCMISDWSGISLEYAFTFERPVIFIDVPKKELNQDSNKISLEPIEISIRKKIGVLINPKNLVQIPNILSKIDSESRSKEINELCSKTVFNINKSACVGAEYIKKILDS